jgi:hypothetical protein
MVLPSGLTSRLIHVPSRVVKLTSRYAVCSAAHACVPSKTPDIVNSHTRDRKRINDSGRILQSHLMDLPIAAAARSQNGSVISGHRRQR